MQYIKVFFCLCITQFFGLCLVFIFRNLDPDQRVPLPDLFLYISIFLGLITFFLLFGLRRLPAIRSTGICETPTRAIFAILATFVFLTLPLQTIGNVDRSRSMYLLGWVGCYDSVLSIQELKKRVNEEYGRETVLAMEQRLDEHQKRGIMKITDGEIELTSRGKLILKVSIVLARMFKLKGWQKSEIWESSNCK